MHMIYYNYIKKRGGKVYKYIKRSSIVIIAAVTTIGFLNLNNHVSAIVPGINQRISLRYTGEETTKTSSNPLVSANGQAVVYDSNDAYILSTGGQGIFKHNITTGATERVNISTAGTVSDTTSWTSPESISASGRYILFRSAATNLIDGMTLPVTTSNVQLYLRDTVASTTELISQVPGSNAGTISNGNVPIRGEGVSSDGRFVLFVTNASNLHVDATDGKPHVYMLDRLDNTLSILDRKTDGSVQDYPSSHNAMSADMSCDGSLVVLQSRVNLIVGDSPSSGIDIYLLDRRGDTSKLTNITRLANGPSYGPTISCNGDFIGFKSKASNLDPTISVTANATITRPYIFDRVNESYHLASVTTSGTEPTGGICGASGNDYFAESVPCIWLSDTGLGVFKSNNSSLTGDSGRQVYIRDIYANTTELVSKNSSGVASNMSHGGDVKSISADGTITTYSSNATNLVPEGTNGHQNIFTSRIEQ